MLKNKSLHVSCFDMIGPRMIGPSSSHTAGACRLAHWAQRICGEQVEEVCFTLYGSFASTWKGHGTDRALLAGIMGYEVDDPIIREAYSQAAKNGLRYRFVEDSDTLTDHPNTVKMDICTRSAKRVSVLGESIGGGRARITSIDDIEVKFNGRLNSILVYQSDKPGVLAHITRCFAKRGLNIAFLNLFRRDKGHDAFTLVESDEVIEVEVLSEIEAHPEVSRVLLLENEVSKSAESTAGAATEDFLDEDGRVYCVASGQEMLEVCSDKQISIAELMCRREMFLSSSSRQQVRREMKKMWEAMRTSVEEPLQEQRRSMGGLIGGEAKQLLASFETQPKLLGEVGSRALAYALAVLEQNSSMGLIVAAPTAGASGVLPATLYALNEIDPIEEEALIDALFVAAALAFLIQLGFSLSGAEGGCQAEVGSAAGMTAAAVVSLYKSEASPAFDAASMALMNLLGLVCDPIGGLVELPCQIRNGNGAVAALAAAQMALAGVTSVLPIDEMIEVCKKVGDSLPAALRETAKGGVAAAASAQKCLGCGLH
ncbi:MAG: L-serine ammonia-lyase, iron-sulfur-dependent, subunit alpha [Eubacteriales bacterium]|nr:L-serine ammonia-lyase, iron-sulfur-dependent, subunit alpha [Eubacteriales bacterium]